MHNGFVLMLNYIGAYMFNTSVVKVNKFSDGSPENPVHGSEPQQSTILLGVQENPE